MSLDLSDPSLALSFLPSTYHVLRLPRTTPLPSEITSLLSKPATSSSFFSLTLTPTETSVILPSAAFANLPADVVSPHSPIPGTDEEGPWALLKVAGPMQLHLTGILHAFVGPLKDAGVAIFASSTYDTDYVLVHAADQEKAELALRRAGWVFKP